MKVLIYPDHHCLPFWSAGEDKSNTCIQVVDLKTLDQWRSFKENKENESVSFSDRPMYPVFKALAELECFPGVVAHISFDFNKNTLECEEYYVKRKWIQFSTTPEFIDGIPQVFLGGKVLVENLWVADNATYSPYEFLDPSIQNFDPNFHTVSFWEKWFTATLMSYRDDEVSKANQQIKVAEHVLSLYCNFPKKEDVCF